MTENSDLETKHVGLKIPNELGIYDDMSGNVDEWCQDWYDEDYYKTCCAKQGTVVHNPKGPENGEFIALCAVASWGSSAMACRSTLQLRAAKELEESGD
jgi:formylglycine-generating enzyme required for sulfatase activity